MLSAFIKKLNERRQHWISEAAYYKALARGFEPDHELDDWLAAEQDYFSMLIDLQLNILEEDGTISTMGLRQIAESLGVENSQLLCTEFDLIRTIQDASHHKPCFRSEESPNCQDHSCHWKIKCRKIIAIWHT
jgi:hypothetical protein